MKILILILGYLLLVAPCQAAEKQPEQEEQALQQLEHQKKEFEKIEKYISRQRREIEHYYRGRLVELKHRTQSEIRLLETAEKTMYTGLAVQAEVAKAVLHLSLIHISEPTRPY